MNLNLVPYIVAEAYTRVSLQPLTRVVRHGLLALDIRTQQHCSLAASHCVWSHHHLYVTNLASRPIPGHESGLDKISAHPGQGPG